jgi:hypothetical protein
MDVFIGWYLSTRDNGILQKSKPVALHAREYLRADLPNANHFRNLVDTLEAGWKSVVYKPNPSTQRSSLWDLPLAGVSATKLLLQLSFRGAFSGSDPALKEHFVSRDFLLHVDIDDEDVRSWGPNFL